MIRIASFLLALCVTAASDAAPARRRALLVGINDYTATELGPRPARAQIPDRDWPNLAGAVNDQRAMREMLLLLHDFAARDIATLTDQFATRNAILSAIEEHLVKPAARGDVVVFYYAGHGSQVRNTASDEPDQLDESIVPADSRAGAPDIRDKELRRLFNRIVRRGAHLTIILDNCHSGSGARGPLAQVRGIAPDRRDVADRNQEKAPEDSGAVVISATQDYEIAGETRDDQKNIRGVFSWAWQRAMRDAAPDESAMETFLRAQARMRGETPYQDPVIAGNSEARARPLFGTRAARPADRSTLAVERVRSDGSVRIQGGWLHGLSIGTELRVRGGSDRLVVTAMHGIARSEARVLAPSRATAIKAGALLEIDASGSSPSRSRRADAWHSLESPSGARAHYRLGIMRGQTPVAETESLHGGDTYRLVLRAAATPLAPRVPRRFYYAFTIDAAGNGVLLFPRRGSVENRFPLSPDAPPAQIALDGSSFRVGPPYGVDTYFLLSTDEALPNPWVLEPRAIANGARSQPLVAPASWTLEKIVLPSIPPRK